MINTVTTRKGDVVKTPSAITTFFNHPLASLLWLPIRVWLGWQWVTAGIHKFENPAWMQTGAALKGYWGNVVAIPETGNPAIHYEWFRGFLQFLLDTQAYTWFAKLIAVGEFLVGIALILGLFTGLAALMGGFMNFNFMMAGSAGVNPMFFIISVLLVLAWKIAGHIGADYYLVPWLGGLWGQKREKRTVQSPEGAEA